MVSHSEFANCFGGAGPPPCLPIRTLEQRAHARVHRPEIRQLWEILRQSYRKQNRPKQPRNRGKRHGKRRGF
jgi:hypothetical protein